MLGLIFEQDPGRPHKARQDVPAWFANLLPEGPLRQLITEKAGRNEARSLLLLRILGGDLPGAVTVRTAGEDPCEHQLKDPSDGDHRQLEFSLAGMEMKLSAVQEEGQFAIPISGAGGGSWKGYVDVVRIQLETRNAVALFFNQRRPPSKAREEAVLVALGAGLGR